MQTNQAHIENIVPIPAGRPDGVDVIVGQWLKTKMPGLKPETRRVYTIGARHFLGFMLSIDVTQIRQIKPDHVLAYRNGLSAGHGLSLATQKIYLKIARYVCEYAIASGRLSENPFDNAVRSQVLTTGIARHTIECGDIKKMIEACGETSTADRRDRAIIGLLFSAALPLRAAIKLNEFNIRQPPVNCVQPSGTVVYAAHGGRVVEVGIDPQTLEFIEAWLDVRHAYARKNSPPALFLSRRGNRMTLSSLNGLIQRRAKAVGLLGVNASGIRKRRAVEIMASAGVKAASFHLGHNCEKTTREILGPEIAAFGIDGGHRE